MKRFLSVIVFIFMFSSQAFASMATDSINNFAFSAGKIIGQSERSYFFSPFSIISAFGMVYAGAEGETAREIETVLGFSRDIHASLGELAGSLEGSGQMTSANRVWLSRGLTVRRSFRETLSRDYGSDAQELDFWRRPERSRKTINDWVADKTNGRIKNLLRTLEQDTKMILTSAIYFSAEWLSPFDKGATKTKPFYYDGKKSINVPMMIQNDDFDYAELDGVKVIRLPYRGREFSMVIALPVEGQDMELDAEIFSGWLKSLDGYKVDLWLPKFKAENKYELREMFGTLGVRQAFSDEADFSGITGDERLRVDAVVHQTFIDVDEEKTEAAAATAITMLRATAVPMMRPRARFHADHPFMYFIVDNNDTILFIGRQTFE